MRFQIRKNIQGIAALPTMLALGGIIVNIVIVIALGVYLLTNSQFGQKLMSEAAAAARAGIQDGLIRIARNREYSGTYNLTVSNRTVNVDICKELSPPQCVGVGKRRITAIGNAMTRSVKMEAIVSLSPIGEIQLESIKETPL